MKHAMTSMTVNHCCVGTQQALLARELRNKIVSMVKWQQPSQLQLHAVPHALSAVCPQIHTHVA